MKLEELIAYLERLDQDFVVEEGFHRPHCYRGDYTELAFEPVYCISVAEMLAAARSAVGVTFEGYKGGQYTMDGWSEVHVARYGSSRSIELNKWSLRGMLSRTLSREVHDCYWALMRQAGWNDGGFWGTTLDWDEREKLPRQLLQVAKAEALA